MIVQIARNSVFGLISLMISAICLSQTATTPKSIEPASKRPYLVVSLVDSSSEFYPAAELLAARHNSEIKSAVPESLEDLLDELRRIQPAYVAFVIHPDDLDINLVNRLVVLSTKVDSDPFADFAWGVITGRDGAAAEKLVRASDTEKGNFAEGNRGEKIVPPSIAMFGVGGAGLRKSLRTESAWPMGTETIPVTNHLAKGETDEDRDSEFISKVMPGIGKAPIVLLASHGYPDGLVAGPKAADLKDVDLKGCVLLNIACYTGVTKDWYDQDFQNMKVIRKSVDASESFCLQAIDSGVASYFAYTSPRPAGPTMMGDALLIASSGQSVGELFQESQQSVILAHLLSGDDQIKPISLVEGAPIDPARTPGSVVKQFSTGGVLFGDPAFKPFRAKQNSHPCVVKVQENADRLIVEMKIKSPIFHFFAGEQINYWEEQKPALRMECRIPLGDLFVEKVDVTALPEGVDVHRWVAAVEQSSGQRYLRFKLNFEQPQDNTRLMKMSLKGLHAKIELHTSKKETSEESILRFTGK